jgi:transcriptional regulator with XRE-family HTH domain
MGRPFSKSQKARIKKKVSELYLEGLEQTDIASRLGCSQATVSHYLAELSNDWIHDGIFNIDEAKRAELAKINALELTAWDAWKRSIGLKNRKTKTTGISAQGNSVDELSVVKWREVGDPRFLVQIQWCINKRCEILGINAPQKSEVDIPAFRSLTDFVQAMMINANK